jgi:chromosome segregation ATPase
MMVAVCYLVYHLTKRNIGGRGEKSMSSKQEMLLDYIEKRMNRRKSPLTIDAKELNDKAQSGYSSPGKGISNCLRTSKWKYAYTIKDGVVTINKVEAEKDDSKSAIDDLKSAIDDLRTRVGGNNARSIAIEEKVNKMAAQIDEISRALSVAQVKFRSEQKVSPDEGIPLVPQNRTLESDGKMG